MPAARTVRLFHEVRGDRDKPTLVLVRGLARTHRHWTRDFLDALAASFRLFLVDNRGVGRSAVGPLSTTTADMADDLAHAMTEAIVQFKDLEIRPLTSFPSLEGYKNDPGPAPEPTRTYKDSTDVGLEDPAFTGPG